MFLDEENRQGNVAKEFNIGKTKVKICVDYCVKSHSEVEKILNNIARKALPSLNTPSMREDSGF